MHQFQEIFFSEHLMWSQFINNFMGFQVMHAIHNSSFYFAFGLLKQQNKKKREQEMNLLNEKCNTKLPQREKRRNSSHIYCIY